MDEDFDNDIVRGLARRCREAEWVRVQDVGLMGRADPELLEWAAAEARILLSHDVTTMRDHAEQRLQAGLPMSGLFLAPQSAPIGRVIDDLEVVVECSREGEWEGQIVFFPLG